VSDTHDALKEDAEQYYIRNTGNLHRKIDPVHDALRRINGVQPIRSILEIGCSTGWRLETVRKEFGSRGTGLEAGSEAVASGQRLYPELDLRQGLAPEGLRAWLGIEQFDCIVLGFFAYLLPRKEIFRLAADVDELLEDDGHLVVSDFLYPSSISVPYTHHPGLTTYKLDPSSPWSWSPNYCQVERIVYHGNVPLPSLVEPGQWTTVDVLRKLSDDVAYPRKATRP